VVGATGAVGSTMLEVMRDRALPTAEVVPFASERSAGRELDDGLVVRSLDPSAIEGFDIALFSAGSGVSGEWAPRFAAAGAVVVDNSSRWRMEADVPLVVHEVNPETIDAHRGIVANPNCSTMQMVVALAPIHRAVGVDRVVVSTYQSVSGTGQSAVDELATQSHAMLHEMEPPAPEVYPHRIAFNVLPQVETFKDGDDYTTEERKMINETRKILGDDAIEVSPTCVRVPVPNCHSEAINLRTRDELSPEDCRELLAGAPGITVIDDPDRGVYPLPSDAVGRDEVFVGRIRRDPSEERTLNLWVVSDNLRKGAATNAVQLAELLHERGLIGSGARSPA
jgi:aspartate-semialdehyde dehydrogenase